MKSLDDMPRAEVAQKRIALAKLIKDFDRVKAIVLAVTNDLVTIVPMYDF